MNRHIFNELLDYKPFDEVEKTDLNTMIDFVKNNEDVLTRNNTIAHFTASAWILNKDKTKVLMIYHNYVLHDLNLINSTETFQPIYSRIQKSLKRGVAVSLVILYQDVVFGSLLQYDFVLVGLVLPLPAVFILVCRILEYE